jgi:hypothetical protein
MAAPQAGARSMTEAYRSFLGSKSPSSGSWGRLDFVYASAVRNTFNV